MKLLLLSMGGIGDFIETVPSIRALRESGPNDFLGLVVAERVKAYASRCPYVNRVYACPVPKPGLSWTSRVVSGGKISALLLQLRFKHFDLVLNFMDVGSEAGAWRMQQFIRFSGPLVSGGRNRSGLGRFFDKQVVENDGDGKSDAEYFYAVASLAGRPLSVPRAADLWILDEERAEAKRLVSNLRGDGPLIVVHPGSDRETRRWFPYRFAQVASELSRRYHARIAVVGNRGDWPVISEIEKLARPSSAQALPFLKSIGTLAAIIQEADLVICNNSMAVHMSAAIGIPCVAVSASGDVARDRPPWNRERLELLWKPLECSPCYYGRCPRSEYMECMERISVDEVLKASEKYLAKQAVV